MATTNTVAAAWAHFFAYMEELEDTSGGGSIIKIEKVIEGDPDVFAWPKPFLAVTITGQIVASRSDNDKVWEQTIKLRIVATSPGMGQAIGEIAAKIAQVEDKIEAYSKPGGVSGFENARWGVGLETGPEIGFLVTAASIRTFSVKVGRGAN